MTGQGLIVSGILFGVVGAMGYRYAYGLARVERNWTMRHAMSGTSEPRNWEVWLFRLSAAAATALGVVVSLLGVLFLVAS